MNDFACRWIGCPNVLQIGTSLRNLAEI